MSDGIFAVFTLFFAILIGLFSMAGIQTLLTDTGEITPNEFYTAVVTCENNDGLKHLHVLSGSIYCNDGAKFRSTKE